MIFFPHINHICGHEIHLLPTVFFARLVSHAHKCLVLSILHVVSGLFSQLSPQIQIVFCYNLANLTWPCKEWSQDQMWNNQLSCLFIYFIFFAQNNSNLFQISHLWGQHDLFLKIPMKMVWGLERWALFVSQLCEVEGGNAFFQDDQLLFISNPRSN